MSLQKLKPMRAASGVTLQQVEKFKYLRAHKAQILA